MPFSLAIRVWDVFLYYGDCILIVMAYNIIKMHRSISNFCFIFLQLNMQKLFRNYTKVTVRKFYGIHSTKISNKFWLYKRSSDGFITRLS